MADPALEALLEVQAADLGADQLRRRRRTLPEREELHKRQTEIEGAGAELAGRQAELTEVMRRQRRLEDSIASLEGRAKAEDARLYSGSVSAPRELQGIQDELESLRRRIGVLEDELLEVLEVADPVERDVARREQERAAAEADAVRLGALLADAEADIDARLAAAVASRADPASRVPGDLMATYEGLRTKLGGVGVARLDGNRCTGCHLTLPAMEAEAVRRAHPGAIVRHDECGRILASS